MKFFVRFAARKDSVWIWAILIALDTVFRSPGWKYFREMSKSHHSHGSLYIRTNTTFTCRWNDRMDYNWLNNNICTKADDNVSFPGNQKWIRARHFEHKTEVQEFRWVSFCITLPKWKRCALHNPKIQKPFKLPSFTKWL